MTKNSAKREYVPASSLPLRSWISITIHVMRVRILEFVRFDSQVASLMLFSVYTFTYVLLRLAGRTATSLVWLGRIYRHVPAARARRFATQQLIGVMREYSVPTVGRMFSEVTHYNKSITRHLHNSIVASDNPFDGRLIVLSPPVGDRKGVILIKYTEYFKYMPEVFDIPRLNEKYVFVYEPSSAGYLSEDLLCLLSVENPAIIQAPESVDYGFLKELNTHLIPTTVGANGWVDSRAFYPLQPREKSYDIIMVAIWADVKRHYHLFSALSKCKNPDKVKVALVGVPWPLPQKRIEDLAAYYRVSHCVEFFERLPQAKINELMSLSRVALLLSKKEGINKFIVESMHAGVPAFLLQGFNFGQRYSYVNEATGGFVDGKRLAQFIDNIEIVAGNSQLHPAEWVREHYSAEVSTSRIVELLNDMETKWSVRINKRLAIKVNNPDLDYLDSNDWERLSECYRSLRDFLRSPILGDAGSQE